MSESLVIVHADAGLLAQAVAARLLVQLVDAQAKRDTAGLVLTGGTIAEELHRELARRARFRRAAFREI